MSNAALNWAFAAGLDSGPKFVLVALADHAGDHAGEDWTCWPSNERLMEFCSLPLRTLERHLATLWKAGWITRETPRDGRGRVLKRRYTLHRNADTRAALAMERTRPEGDAMETQPEHPPANMAGGETDSPPAKNAALHPPKSGHPPANMAGGHNKEEPPEEPSGTPTQGAGGREPAGDAGADWCGVAWAAMPDQSRRWSSRRLWDEAWAVERVHGGDPTLIAAACNAYRADPSRWGSSGKPVSAHRFLGEGRWRDLVAASAPLSRGGVMPGGAWSGPADIRTAFVSAWGGGGEARAVSCLDPSAWDGEARTITPRTGHAYRALTDAGRLCRELNITIIAPGSTGAASREG